MKNWFTKLSLLYKTALVSFIAVILVFLALIFGYFVNKPYLPNGLILGGCIGVLSYLALALVDKHDENSKKPVFTIVITIVRYLLIAAAVVLSALSQYKWGYKIFNLFTLMGGYLISLVVYLIITLAEKKNV